MISDGYGCLDPGKLKDLSELTDKGYPTSRYSIDFDGDYPGLSALLA